MIEKYTAKIIKVNGIVQGVGFRPFIYQLANQFQLKGEVANTSSGVIVHIEGTIQGVNAFLNNLKPKSPPLSQIINISVEDVPLEHMDRFVIKKSRTDNQMATLISPDVSICDDCIAELFDPSDRRYRYPFINCTNCGPRYTIIDDIPYDRPKTSMKHFQMCQNCQTEYDDPGDRRFHAQPNACSVCGPHITLYDNTVHEIKTSDPIQTAISFLKKGSVIAIKGLGGFHLAVDGENNVAVNTLRQRKHREEKPLALMSLEIKKIRKFAFISPDEEKLLMSQKRPIVLLKKRIPNSIASAVSPQNKYFGVMLPYTPLHYLILKENFTALVMTSGNISEEPIAIENEDAFKRLTGIAEYFLVHNRNIYLRSDDSIVRKTAAATRIIRRSRGYVPVPVFLKRNMPKILACGAELKNTVCLTKSNQAFLSQHIGDLENLATNDFFEMTIDHMKRILNIEPEVIAHDMHPDYLSSQYAKRQKSILKIPVQHHHAHIASVMAENKLDGPVIGLSFDGTGFGTDGNIWGGEIIVAKEESFHRAAHINYVPMPGGSSAITEPWRMAISYLFDAFGQNFWNLDLPLLKTIESKKLKIIVHMIEKNVNSPLTSSLGRLFDGVASLIGLGEKSAFEGQVAMALEMTADKSNEGRIYEYGWIKEDAYKILPGPIIKGIVKDMTNGAPKSQISMRFHDTLISLFSEICIKIQKDTKINRVALSGGVFQNSILLSRLIATLEKRNFKVYTQRLVPTNDGGISLGQALVAAAVTK